MTKELKIFKSEQFGQVRTVVIDGELWFVAKDVAMALSYSDTNAMTRRLDSEDVMSVKLSDMNMKSTLINESGLYGSVIGSNKPEAKQFKRWITHEVLPAIRKHGIYATDDFVEQALSDPQHMINILTKFKEERDKRIEAEKTVTILTHVNKTYVATEIAKEAGFNSAQAMNKWLHGKGVQYKQNGTWLPYAKYANLGYFDIKQEILDIGDKTKIIYHRKITQRGREFILKMREVENAGTRQSEE